jgi:hypothetical protein
MKFFSSALTLFLFLVVSVSGLAQASKEDKISGTWKGTSVCQVKDSPCQDEVVVYYFTRSPATGIYTVQMNKVVNNEEEEMAELDFSYNAASKTLLCKRDDRFRSVWKFEVKGKTMLGSLTINEKTLYRIIQVQKQ